MYDNQNDYLLDRANRVPPRLSIGYTLNEGNAAGIVEYQLSRFEFYAVLLLVDLVFDAIPFNPHLYLHYRKYSLVAPGSTAPRRTCAETLADLKRSGSPVWYRDQLPV